MDLAALRKRYRESKKVSQRVRAGHAAIHANAERRYHILLDEAERGATLEEAAACAGYTVDAAKQSLWRHTGSTCWPPRIKIVGENK